MTKIFWGTVGRLLFFFFSQHANWEATAPCLEVLDEGANSQEMLMN